MLKCFKKIMLYLNTTTVKTSITTEIVINLVRYKIYTLIILTTDLTIYDALIEDL